MGEPSSCSKWAPFEDYVAVFRRPGRQLCRSAPRRLGCRRRRRRVPRGRRPERRSASALGSALRRDARRDEINSVGEQLTASGIPLCSEARNLFRLPREGLRRRWVATGSTSGSRREGARRASCSGGLWDAAGTGQCFGKKMAAQRSRMKFARRRGYPHTVGILRRQSNGTRGETRGPHRGWRCRRGSAPRRMQRGTRAADLRG